MPHFFAPELCKQYGSKKKSSKQRRCLVRNGRYDSSLPEEVPNCNTPEARCAFLRAAGGTAVCQAGIKLDLKLLYLAQGGAVAELLKLALPLAAARRGAQVTPASHRYTLGQLARSTPDLIYMHANALWFKKGQKQCLWCPPSTAMPCTSRGPHHPLAYQVQHVHRSWGERL